VASCGLASARRPFAASRRAVRSHARLERRRSVLAQQVGRTDEIAASHGQRGVAPGIGRGVLGALLFAFVYALQLRLRILPEFSDVPFELLLAPPYVVVILALALSGRNVAYPGAYLKPYRRA
jgi:hypothetical protein